MSEDKDEDPAEADEGARRLRDLELLTIERIVRMLAELDQKAQARCMVYLAARYAEGK